MLTENDHKRIADAITLAESKTSGEIFCVLTHQVSRYREVPLAWARGGRPAAAAAGRAGRTASVGAGRYLLKLDR